MCFEKSVVLSSYICDGVQRPALFSNREGGEIYNPECFKANTGLSNLTPYSCGIRSTLYILILFVIPCNVLVLSVLLRKKKNFHKSAFSAADT